MNNSSSIFVSGGAGFLASHLIKLLLEKGHKVVTNVRSLSTSKYEHLYNLVPNSSNNLKVCEAELTDSKSWIPAIKGCECVFHLASPNPPQSPADENEIIKPALEGTLNILNAALYNQCKKVVITSSLYTIIVGHDGKICDENDWSDLSKLSNYPKSKYIAEKAAWDFYEKHKEEIQISIINPSWIIGPSFTPHNVARQRLVFSLLNGSLPGIPNFPVVYQTVDVREVALAHYEALINENCVGKRYIICGDEKLTLNEIIQILKNELGKFGYTFPEKEMTKEEIIKSGNSSLIKFANNPVFQVSNSKSKEDLKIKYREAKDSVVETAYSLINNGLIPNLLKK